MTPAACRLSDAAPTLNTSMASAAPARLRALAMLGGGWLEIATADLSAGFFRAAYLIFLASSWHVLHGGVTRPPWKYQNSGVKGCVTPHRRHCFMGGRFL